MKIFSGTNSQELSQKVADELNISLGKAEVIRFDNSEVRVTIQDDVKNETCVVIQTTSQPTDTNFMELVFFCDALKRKEAKKVIAIIPYFGYARQSIQHRDGECVSVNVIIKILESIGFDKVYTFDLHDRATEGVFTIPFKHLSAVEILANATKELLDKNSIDPEHISIVSPDQGGIASAREFGEHLFGTTEFSLAVIEKRRSYTKIHSSTSLGLYGDVKGKIAIIVDDMITSGGTLVQAVELCEKNGATTIYAAATHPDFSENANNRIEESSMKALLVTDTIQPFHKITSKKIMFKSIAPMIATELKDID
jgi:ribose-phosphate pyrophosphokinase